MKTRKLIVWATLVLAVGCAVYVALLKPAIMGKRNLPAAREITLAAVLFSRSAAGDFPKKLDDLVNNRLLKEIPQCICDDGKVRDFVYFPGYNYADPIDLVVLASPPEMNRQLRILGYLDGSCRILSVKAAAGEIQKSTNYLAPTQSSFAR